MHIFKAYYPNVYEDMNKLRYVVGRVEGPLDLEPGEKVIFAGDCTSWEGDIHGEHVVIKPTYKTTDQVDARRTKSNDMIYKIGASLLNCVRSRNKSHLHARGCTVSVAEHVNYFSYMGNIGNVNFDPRMLIPLNLAYWQMRAMRLINQLK